MLNISPECQIYFSHMPTYAKYMTKIPYICSIYAHHVSNIQMYMSMISQILKWMLNNHECPPVKQSEWSSWSCSPRVGIHRAWPDRPRSCSPSTRCPDSPVQWPSCQSQLFGSSFHLNCNLSFWNWPWKPRFRPPCVNPCPRSCTLPLPNWTLLTWTSIENIKAGELQATHYLRPPS